MTLHSLLSPSLLLFCLVLSSFAADDLYDILGVPRSASSQEIKRAYKNLAREWHPDKNKDPSATDKFTKINEAYETLSDPERRSNYDKFGYTSAQEQRPRGPTSGFHTFDEFFMHTNFGNFGFGGRETESMDKFLTTLRHYETKLHPESHQNPCFIYAYTDFCFNCMRIEPVIYKFMTELENVGLCVMAVHLRRSPGLASYLRLHTAPNILGVVSGRQTFYKGTGISFESLRDFVKGLFPSGTLPFITDNMYNTFLEGWKDNRVRAIFFGSKPSPSLRFLAPAFFHRDRIACGYVHTTGPGADEIMRKFNINKHRETLLLWNEVTDSTLAAIVMQQLSRATVDEVFSNNRYLALPRLSSQAVFDELCPQEPKIKRRRLCVAPLIMSKVKEHEVARHTFQEFAQSTEIQDERVRYAYIYEDVQRNFIKALTKGNETRSQVMVEVVIIWRQDTRRLNYEFLAGGWSLDPETVPQSRKELEERLTQILDGDNLLPYRAIVPEFYNEHMLGLFTRIFYKLYDWYDRIFYFCSSYGMSLLTALAALAFLGTVSYSMKKLAAAEAEEMKKKRMPKRSQQRPPSCSPDNQTIHLYELKYETFQNLVSEADTGLTITLLVDEHTKDKLMRKFAEIMQPFSRYSALTFAFLQLEYYLDWYRTLLELSMEFKVTLESINNRNCVGSVLAINGYRKYYYIYHPKRARRWMRQQHGSNITKAVGFGDSDSDSNDDERKSREEDVIFEDELLCGLAIWMDRVFDGSVKKVRLPYWPEMSK